MLANLLNPILELLIQPGERPLQAKISIYSSARVCLRSAYVVEETKDPNEKNADWLTSGLVVGEASTDPILEVLSSKAHELSQCIARDIVDLPQEHKIFFPIFIRHLVYKIHILPPY
ncbi:unnamed protein product [Cylicostephanus goldi]|uniref:Uncharacterized protein n=1 Tax=Cylicostephanus goldi TaxID=71465 RepID=A0A3P6STW4_CYLGO|nr:unnamed protein product [Cylicostephanus goldi]